MTTSPATSVRTPQGVLRSAGMADDAVRRVAARHGDGLSYAFAMNLAAFYQRLVEGGIPFEAAGEIAAAQGRSSLALPRDQADAVVPFFHRAVDEGMEPSAAVEATVAHWTASSQGAAAAAAQDSAMNERADADRPTPPDAPRHSSMGETMGKRRSMTDHEKHNGTELERGKLEKERERLEREREKLERLQEEMEARIERQQERLEELEDELEAREEELDEREEELGELEVEGAEGVREVLDVVSERIPNLMRGIQETVYSPENLKKTADALATFFKNLVDAGMDPDEAAEMTKLQMMFMQRQGSVTAEPFGRVTRARRGRPARPHRPAEPAEPVEPAELKEEDED